MAVHIIVDPTSQFGAAPIISDRPLYTDATGTRLLEEGDKDATTLVVSHAGKPIDANFVQSLALEADKGGKVKQRSAGKNKERVDGQDKDVPTVHDATPPKDDGVLADPIVSAGASIYESYSKSQLNKLAKERGVPGYTKLSDVELRAALAEGGAMQSGAGDADSSADDA